MPDMAARHNENPSGAHPGLEAQLEILPSPDIESGVVAAQLEKEVAGDCKQTAGHRGGGNRGCRRRRPGKMLLS